MRERAQQVQRIMKIITPTPPRVIAADEFYAHPGWPAFAAMTIFD